MSHVCAVDIHIKDLDALKAACKALGLEFRENQKTYKWFGRSVGDYPLPVGYSAGQLGKCEHAIGIPDNPNAYEIGVVRRLDGQPGYALLWDFWHGGYGLQDAVGQDANYLRQQYALKVAEAQLYEQGYMIEQTICEDGRIRLTCSQ